MNTENTKNELPENEKAAPDLGTIVRETVEKLGRGLEIMRGGDAGSDA